MSRPEAAPIAGAALQSPFIRALTQPGAVRAAELRPPAVGQDPAKALDAWIEAHHAVRSLTEDGRFVLYTDDAVGDREEESLRLLTSDLGAGDDLSRIVPFLTCKHPLDYCLLFARRAASHGLGAVTVTGGDKTVGPPRCLPRSRQLREHIRSRTPGLAMGTWANPYRDPARQVGFLLGPAVHADYFLTQIVSHHMMDPVDAFLEESEKRGLRMPGMFGVFYFRSGNLGTLERLAQFFPVPVQELRREFEAGERPEEVCARTIRALRSRGVENVYVCNLGSRRAAQRMREIEARL